MTSIVRGLLRQFVECDAIVNYDSTFCWGCGEPKFAAGGEPGTCDEGCLLDRARKALDE